MLLGDTIYLDYQASTPVDARVLKAMQEASMTLFANPHAAGHVLGWQAAAAIEKAAQKVGNLFGIEGDDVIFTSGASESNAMVFRTARSIAKRSKRNEVLVGAADHGSTLNEAANSGLIVRHIPLNEYGAPDPAYLKSMLSDATALVSIVGVNNENGAIANLKDISDLCSSAGTMLHVDLSQAPLAIDVDVFDLNISLATVSAHKLYGPKGVGALLTGIGASSMVRPLITGAGQQGGYRGGTMPTELIVGFGKACDLIREERHLERTALMTVRNLFVETLEKKRLATLIGSLKNRHPGNALMRFPNKDASDILARLQPQIAASTQSACSSGNIEPSHVLLAMGLDQQKASECIRFSFGRFSTKQQVNAAVNSLSRVLKIT